MTVAEKAGVPNFSPYGLPLASRVALAPMSGVTDAGMRALAQECGAGFVVTEMVACDAFVEGEEEHRLRAEGQGMAPHIVQLAGCEPHWMAEAARLAEASGADVIDINMGCPAKRVTGGWSGSALMRDLDHALRLIEAVVGAVKVPVSLKMRLGWDHASLNAPELARQAEAAGIRLLTVHGRTRQQFYKGRADWTAIRAVREASSLPLVANGDIGTVAEARTCLAASGADAVMVGRAAIGRAWLPGAIGQALARGDADIARPDAAKRLDLVLRHYDWLLTHFGRDSGVRHARKHLAAAMDDHLSVTESGGAGGQASLRAAILTVEDPVWVERALETLFAAERRAEAA